MDGKRLTVVFIVFISVFVSAWKQSREREDRRDTREIRDDSRRLHYMSKRHMLPEVERKPRRPPRPTTTRSRDVRKKPSGHLTPLQEDDIDNDEVVSVAIGPPPLHPKYDKMHWKKPKAPTNNSNATSSNIIKDVLIELGREFISRQISEEFVFGQYIGNVIKNLTLQKKLEMQHDILELILKYQKLDRKEVKPENKTSTVKTPPSVKEIHVEEKTVPTNETTEDGWPDFTNLANIVG